MQTEHNMWVHLALSVIACFCGALLAISRNEWIALVIVMAMVWMAELLNTAIEKMADFISLKQHPRIKLIKDLSAATVLVAAVAAFIVGCIILIPKLF